MTNPTDERIKKLWTNGNHSIDSIARKIGRPGDFQRVMDALERLGFGEQLAEHASDEMSHEY